MIEIRPSVPTDASALAELIIEAMTPCCCAYFYGEQHTLEEFQRFLVSLIQRTDTQYSYQNALVAVVGDAVVGAAVSYDGALLRQLREPFIKGVKAQFDNDLRGMRDETGPGELYLDSFAVSPAYRHKGIGSQLLKATVEKAGLIGIENVGLLVDDENPTALRLYLNAGFHFVDTSSWGGHSMKHLQIHVN